MVAPVTGGSLGGLRKIYKTGGKNRGPKIFYVVWGGERQVGKNATALLTGWCIRGGGGKKGGGRAFFKCHEGEGEGVTNNQKECFRLRKWHEAKGRKKRKVGRRKEIVRESRL